MIHTAPSVPLTIHNAIQKDTVTFLRRTDGQTSTLVDVELAPGGGNGLHFHTAYAEAFTCLDGVLGLHIDGLKITLEPGQSVLAPVGSVHRFYNTTSAPVRFRTEITPGHRGFEEGLMIAYGMSHDGLLRRDGMPRSLAHLALLVDLTDSRLVGPLKVLNVVFASLARWARARGVEAELFRRYVLPLP